MGVYNSVALHRAWSVPHRKKPSRDLLYYCVRVFRALLRNWSIPHDMIWRLESSGTWRRVVYWGIIELHNVRSNNTVIFIVREMVTSKFPEFWFFWISVELNSLAVFIVERLNFTSGGLHEKHAVATRKLTQHLLEDRRKPANNCRDCR
jgi:hypothetical protein